MTTATTQATKTFTAWTGDRELTREEYIQEWLDATIQFGTLFGGDDLVGKYLDFRGAIIEVAGKKWDKQ
jgi:hypothetical protein